MMIHDGRAGAEAPVAQGRVQDSDGLINLTQPTRAVPIAMGLIDLF